MWTQQLSRYWRPLSDSVYFWACQVSCSPWALDLLIG
jgi:hypothetical protein